jgi:hypothetical protein
MVALIADLLHRKEFKSLAAILADRWGTAPSQDALECLHRLAFVFPRASIGGSPIYPWSEDDWLKWMKGTSKICDQDPSYARSILKRPHFNPPASGDQWRSFLERYTDELLQCDDLPIADEDWQLAGESHWMGFAPASAGAIRSAERRLGRSLPESLRQFYGVTNGWRATGRKIYDVLPVEQAGWLSDRQPDLHALASMAEATPGPFKKDLGGARLRHYRDEQGTRVKRSLVLNADGDAATWLLDPGSEEHTGEWPGGCWASWNPAMEWTAVSFAELMTQELATLISLREDS